MKRQLIDACIFLAKHVFQVVATNFLVLASDKREVLRCSRVGVISHSAVVTKRPDVDSEDGLIVIESETKLKTSIALYNYQMNNTE